MKQIFLLMLSATLMLGSCSKSKDDAKPDEGTTVEINGQTYKTIKIGTQTWTAVNYNGEGGVNYNDGANDPTYGKLYTIPEAKAIQLPEGWRLPSWQDYNKLLGAVGATSKDADGVYDVSEAITKKLMSKTGWVNNIGTNEVGFNAYPAGDYDIEYSWKGTAAVFLTTSTFADINNPNYTDIPASFVVYSGKDEPTSVNYTTGVGFSDYVVGQGERGAIRFVKDN